MESEPAHHDVQAQVMLEIGQVFMHRLLNKEITLFTSGSFRVAKLSNNQGQPVHFLNINSFYYGIQPDTFFVKVTYADTIAYVFPHFEQGLSSISIPTNPTFMEPLDNLLGAISRIYDPKTALQHPQLRAIIMQHYPQIQTQQIYYPDNIKKVIVGAGSFFNKAFTTIGGYLKTGVQKCGNYIDSKLTQGQPTQLSENTKQKWQDFKEGTTKVFHVSGEYAVKILNPVVDKTKEFGKKINQSQNNTVIYAKEIAMASGKAVGQAFDGFVKGGTEVAGELGQQSKKLINKKYGPDVVNTITGKKEEHPAGNQEVQKVGDKPDPKEPHPQPPPEEQHSDVRLNNNGENLYPSLQK